MFIIIVFDRVLSRSSPVSSLDFCCSLPRVGHGMQLGAWEFLLIKCVFHFAFLHLLSGSYYYDCSNRCTDALAVNMKFSIESHLLRLMRLNS